MVVTGAAWSSVGDVVRSDPAGTKRNRNLERKKMCEECNCLRVVM